MAGSDGGPLGVFVFLTEREGKERGRRQEEEGDGARVSLRLGCGIKGEGRWLREEEEERTAWGTMELTLLA
jgi:hypothetical protein